MYRKVIIVTAFILLVGCSLQAEPKYDIDVTCHNPDGSHHFIEETPFGFDTDTPIDPLRCVDDKGNDFYISCIHGTVQEVNNLRLCSTKDKKNVRVTLTK